MRFARIAAAALLLGGAAQPVVAAPDFSKSTITASRSQVIPLQTIDYTSVVRNTGDASPQYLMVTSDIPTSAMYVSSSPDWVFDAAERRVSWSGNLAPGESRELQLTVVTRRDSAGLTLANRTEINFGEYWGLDHDLQIDSPPMQAGLTTAGKLVFGYIAFALAASALILMSARRRTVALVSGVMGVFISIGFLLFFADIARRDHRMKSVYRETQCTIVDSLAKFTANTDTTSRQRGGTWAPAFAVRYGIPGGETVSVSRRSDSALSFGSPKPTEAALAGLPRGGKAPCWYDPEAPQDVVLDRSVGGAYGFAVLPLLLLAGAGFLLRAAARS